MRDRARRVVGDRTRHYGPLLDPKYGKIGGQIGVLVHHSNGRALLGASIATQRSLVGGAFEVSNAVLATVAGVDPALDMAAIASAEHASESTVDRTPHSACVSGYAGPAPPGSHGSGRRNRPPRGPWRETSGHRAPAPTWLADDICKTGAAMTLSSDRLPTPRTRLTTLACALGLTLLAVSTRSQQPDRAPSPSPSFVANHGQWPAEVRFRYTDGPATAWLHDDGLTLTLVRSSQPEFDAHAEGFGEQPVSRRQTHLRLSFAAAAHAEPRGEQRQRQVHNYYIGNDASRWASAVPTFARVVQPEVAPGVDAVWQHRDGRLAYDLHVAPGSREAAALTRVDGAQALRVEPDGSLCITTELGDVTLTAPRAWEVTGNGPRPVPSQFVLVGSARYHIACERIDAGLPLVIDPGLEFSTFLGGIARDSARSVVTDWRDRMYVTGETWSFDFPTTTPQPYGGAQDTFVSCLDADPSLAPANKVIWSTFVGGSVDEGGYDLDVLHGAVVTVVGGTTSPDFPTTANAYAPTALGLADGFAVQLTSTTGALLYGSYFGGGGDDRMCAIELHPAGGFAIAGYTESSNLPTTPGVYQPSYAGGGDAFVVRFDPFATGTAQLLVSTFLGGPGSEGYSAPVGSVNGAFLDLAVDAAGTITLAGVASDRFPTVNAPFPRGSGGRDIFVSQLDAILTSLPYSTLLGSPAEDAAWSVALGDRGQVVVSGFAKGPGFPTTVGAYQRTFGGVVDCAIAVLQPTRGPASLDYSTYIGLGGADASFDAVVESSGVIIADGNSFNGPMPTTPGAMQTTWPVGSLSMGTVLRLDPAGNGSADLHYCSYIGASGRDACFSLALRADGRVVLAGQTDSPSFPTAGNPPQPAIGGGFDAFVAVVDLLPATVTRVGAGTGAGVGFDMQINTAPAAGATLELICNDATGSPPDAMFAGLPARFSTLGVEVLVGPPIVALPVQRVGSSVHVILNVPVTASPPYGLSFQYLSLGNLSWSLAASDALRF